MTDNVAEGATSLADAEEKIVAEKAAGVDGPEGEAAESATGLGEAEEEEAAEDDASLIAAAEEDTKKRRRMLMLLLVLLALLLSVIALLVRYLLRPEPLPDLLPVPVEMNYPPHYLFSIYGMDQPVGVALSPDGDRVYVAETGGERLVRMFDRDGDSLGSFAPPRTWPAERSPVYLATDSTGRVFVTDRLQHAIFAYDGDGDFLDTILSPDLTLSEYVSKHTEGLRPGAAYAHNAYEADVYYQEPGEVEQTFPAPSRFGWAPLGIRIDRNGNMLLTDVDANHNTVRTIPAAVIVTESWQDFNPGQSMFGETGQGDGQLLFPNSAVSDSQGRIYVSDGNNARVSVWNAQGSFLFHFGHVGDGALSLPRGAVMDARDRLHVVDAVGQTVKVYDVYGPGPVFLFAFGDWGLGDGKFNYPNDIALDASGRLYVADRENNRIQVWSY